MVRPLTCISKRLPPRRLNRSSNRPPTPSKMMRLSSRYLKHAAACALVLFTGSILSFAEEPNTLTPAEVAAGWKLMFNGKDLTGWTGSPEVWSVENGTVIGKSTEERPAKETECLVFQSVDYADFELRYKAKIQPVEGKHSWCGFRFRNSISGSDGKLIGPGQNPNARGVLDGSWAFFGKKVRFVDGKPPESRIVQAELEDTKDLEKNFKETEWNDFKVVVVGQQVQLFCNGKLVQDVIDERTDSPKKGRFGILIAFFSRVTIQCKDIKVREIKPASVASTSQIANAKPSAPLPRDSTAPPPLVPPVPSNGVPPVAPRPAPTPFRGFPDNRPPTSSPPSRGTPTPGLPPVAGIDLDRRLVGTTWVWEESKTTLLTLKFASGGEAFRSDYGRRFTWQMTADKKAIEGVTIDGRKFRMTFDPTFTKGRIVEGNQRPRDTRIVP